MAGQAGQLGVRAGRCPATHWKLSKARCGMQLSKACITSQGPSPTPTTMMDMGMWLQGRTTCSSGSILDASSRDAHCTPGCDNGINGVLLLLTNLPWR
jgi:hypothetical protein